MVNVTCFENLVKVTGDIDFYSALGFDKRIVNYGYNQDFSLDLTKVDYIDSSGIGSLISIYNHYRKINCYIYIIASPMVEKILSLCRLDFLFVPKEKVRKIESIAYQESISPNPDVLSKVIDRLSRDLENAGVNKYEANDILVCLDEGLTNAVLETMKHTRKIKRNSYNDRSIVVRWEIRPNAFFATIVDHGGGFNIRNISKALPEARQKDYMRQIEAYQQSKEIKFKADGRNKNIKRFGAGLKIMTSLMDVIMVDLINTKKDLFKESSDDVSGTILNMYRRLGKPVGMD